MVCGRGVTMLSFSPTSAFSSVDLPTLGRPASATKPLRNSLSVTVSLTLWPHRQAFRVAEHALGGLLLGAAAARAAALRAPRQRLDLAAHPKHLRVQFALDALDDVARQRQAPRLQQLLQPRLRVLERRRRRQGRDAPGKQREHRRARAASRPPSRNMRPAQRLERIGQDRLAAKAAGLELPGAQLQHFTRVRARPRARPGTRR